MPAVVQSHSAAAGVLSTLYWLRLLMKKVWPTEGVDPAPRSLSTPVKLLLKLFVQPFFVMPVVPVEMEPTRVLDMGMMHVAHKRQCWVMRMESDEQRNFSLKVWHI